MFSIAALALCTLAQPSSEKSRPYDTTTFTGAFPICDESCASRAFTAGSSTATKSHIW